jgi:hypothetical protein
MESEYIRQKNHFTLISNYRLFYIYIILHYYLFLFFSFINTNVYKAYLLKSILILHEFLSKIKLYLK